MKYLHTMVRVTDIGRSLDFYQKLGLKEVRRMERPEGRYTLIFLAAPGDEAAQVELTYNWDPEVYGEGRNFNRPPRDGRMAFVRSPDNISIELLQKGGALPPQEPWKSMPNTGNW